MKHQKLNFISLLKVLSIMKDTTFELSGISNDKFQLIVFLNGIQMFNKTGSKEEILDDFIHHINVIRAVNSLMESTI